MSQVQAISATRATKRGRKSYPPSSRKERHNHTRPTIPVSSRTVAFHSSRPALTIPTEDERSIGNRLAAAEDQNDDSTGSSGKTKSAETKAGEIDPTAPARMHGNEPSKGAKIDKSIADDEDEILRKMDEKKAQKAANK